MTFNYISSNYIKLGSFVLKRLIGLILFHKRKGYLALPEVLEHIAQQQSTLVGIEVVQISDHSSAVENKNSVSALPSNCSAPLYKT